MPNEAPSSRRTDLQSVRGSRTDCKSVLQTALIQARTARDGRRGAFTLIELLVVIAMPSVSREVDATQHAGSPRM
jgi:hypothetical protein